MFSFRPILFLAAIAVVLPCGAQTTYRWITESGETVYSDQPPPPGTRVIEKIEGSRQEGGPDLPYATRLAAEKYPVTLYTMANCKETCASARTLLNGRGIPFSEKLISTQEELDEVSKEFGGEMVIPSLRVGTQNFRGFEAGSWNNLLDLAGYSKTAPYGSKPSGAFSQ
ncbi:MAG: glutaredoxin family protein [Candidatus Accumulibacter sp.]|jgi:glutaredoxin|nr:glutaredoxin family protein [Accumulibacter sp.]